MNLCLSKTPFLQAMSDIPRRCRPFYAAHFALVANQWRILSLRFGLSHSSQDGEEAGAGCKNLLTAVHTATRC